MKAKDLMIGDLLRWSDNDGKEHITNVTAINEEKDEIDASEHDDPEEWHIAASALRGIPVTENFLKMNGFTIGEFYAEICIDLWTVQCTDNHLRINGPGHDMEVPFAFVHELQHAFKICGIEKEWTI